MKAVEIETAPEYNIDSPNHKKEVNNGHDVMEGRDRQRWRFGIAD